MIVALFILVLFISCTKSFVSFWLFSALAWYLEQLKLNACCKGRGHTYFAYCYTTCIIRTVIEWWRPRHLSHLELFWWLDLPYKGRNGMSDVMLPSGISALSFESPFTSPLLFFSCLVLSLFSRQFSSIFHEDIGFFVWLLLSSYRPAHPNNFTIISTDLELRFCWQGKKSWSVSKFSPLNKTAI